MDETMQAVVMTAVGGPEVLELQTVPRPAIADPHAILVRVRAAGVNPADIRVRERMPPMTEWEVPPGGIILGLEGAGVVEAVGPAVTRFAVGDEVFWFDGGFLGVPGNYAQYKTVHEDYAARKPRRFSFAQAACLPIIAITGWEALHDHARLAVGEYLLVQGGAGGLGHIAIQLGKLCGAQVAATVSSDRKGDLARRLGADRVINYHREDVGAAVREWTGGEGVNVVYDTVGDGAFSASIELLASHGRLVTAAYPTAWPSADIFKAALANVSISFEAMGHSFRSHALRAAQTGILETVARHADEGRLELVVDRTWPLAQAAEAQRALEAGEVAGKVALELS